MEHADTLCNCEYILPGFWSRLGKILKACKCKMKIISWLKPGYIQNDSRSEQKPANLSATLDALYKSFDSVLIKNYVLCSKWKNKTAKDCDTLVLNSQYTWRSSRSSWSLGIAKTFEMIQQKFYWPGFSTGVEKYSRNSETYAKNRTALSPRSPMKPIEVIPILFYMIGVDVIGPLKTASRRNKYILSIIDCYTKYVEAVKLPNQEAVTIARALEDIYWQIKAVILSPR